MKLDEQLLDDLKNHVKAILQAMPDLSQEQREELITKAITDSTDIPENVKEETIKTLLEVK